MGTASAGIDLRSDTVTRPTPAMRRAMAEAEVGDDVFEDDPTVKRLERECAALLGYEAGLFVPSGTMGNICAIATHAPRGTEIVLGDSSHVYLNEVAGAAAIAGVQTRAIANRDGELEPDDVRGAIRTDNVHFPRTSLVCIENTHNFGGGNPLSAAWTQNIVDEAGASGIPVHLDGARLFNAAVALEVEPKELTRGAASTTICLSKGLGAPVGSVLCASETFVHEARRIRKMLGGGMRQVGVIAAAGLLALRDGPKLLAEDHRNARRLAELLGTIANARVEPWRKTNMVFFSIEGRDPDALARRCFEGGLSIVHLGRGRFRAVTHRDVTGDQIERAAEIVERAARVA